MDIWSMPPSGNVTTAVGDLAVKSATGLYYSSGGDRLGYLDTANNKVTMYIIPPALIPGVTYSTPLGIALDGKGAAWCALRDANMLCQLASNGLITVFGTTHGIYGQSGYDPYPFSSPKCVRFDGKGTPWYIGQGAGRGYFSTLVGRLDAGHRTATYWEILNQPLTPSWLWVEQSGKVIWFTLYHLLPSSGNQIPFLGRLDVTSNQVDLWFDTLPPNRGGFWVGAKALAGDKPNAPKALWITYEGPGNETSVLRFDTATKKFLKFSFPVKDPHEPWRIEMAGPDPWFSDRYGSLGSPIDPACGKPFAVGLMSFIVQPRQEPVKGREQFANQETAPLQYQNVPVSAQQKRCFQYYPMPPAVLGSPWEIRTFKVSGGYRAFFSNGLQFGAVDL